jgi:hypothetical protein
MESKIDFEIQYGLYDIKDNVWLGDDAGPKIFTNFMFARIAAEIVDVQLGQNIGRTKVREYDPAPKRLRDEKPLKMNAKEALTCLENGLV